METIQRFTSYPSYLPIIISQKSAESYKETSGIEEEDCVRVLDFGAYYAINGLLHITGIVLQPLLSLVALVAAAVFSIMSCCDESGRSLQAAKTALFRASFIFSIHVLFVRIFYPPFQYEQYQQYVP